MQVFLEESLKRLFSVQGTSSSRYHQQIFGLVSGSSYQRWLLNRVKNIALTSSCNVSAKVQPELEPNTIYISRCANLNPSPADTAYWLSILMHEARHLESHKGHWHHDICLDEFQEVLPCDGSPIGAFGIEKILAANIIKYCQNCSDDFKLQWQQVFEDEQVWKKLKPQAQEDLLRDLP